MRAAKREMVTRQDATVAEIGGDRATIPLQSSRLNEETTDDITASTESAEVDGAAESLQYAELNDKLQFPPPSATAVANSPPTLLAAVEQPSMVKEHNTSEIILVFLTKEGDGPVAEISGKQSLLLAMNAKLEHIASPAEATTIVALSKHNSLDWSRGAEQGYCSC
ncbi:unnamed protein product [Linum trigynum]|uniref:Uncharacterized protein n=1 Tax=Linum trigynum TaxID=586398 RepID=A0AAV2GBX5_9ROSI